MFHFNMWHQIYLVNFRAVLWRKVLLVVKITQAQVILLQRKELGSWKQTFISHLPKHVSIFVIVVKTAPKHFVLNLQLCTGKYLQRLLLHEFYLKSYSYSTVLIQIIKAKLLVFTKGWKLLATIIHQSLFVKLWCKVHYLCSLLMFTTSAYLLHFKLLASNFLVLSLRYCFASLSF